MKKSNLTFKYILHLASYWIAYCGMFSFAATYMLEKGISADLTGIILCGGNFLSFILQPILASFADKALKNVLPGMMAIMAVISSLCFALIRFLNPSIIVFCLAYIIGIAVMDMQIPLLNALNVYYSMRNWHINYELGRCSGAIGFAVASPLIGILMTKNVDYMPLLSVICTLVYGTVSISYPKIDNDSNLKLNQREKSSNLFVFIKQYKWYNLSILGITLLSFVHIMTENYLIMIAKPLGGDSKTIGVALLCATVTEAIAMLFFSKLYRKLGSYKILMLGGIFYTVKMLIFCFATATYHLYIAEALQCVSYVFISPVQMYYANECIDRKDMVKGQSIITAAYSLGLALGNLSGGFIIKGFGVKTMTITAVIVAFAGFLVVLFAVPKAKNYQREESK